MHAAMTGPVAPGRLEMMIGTFIGLLGQLLSYLPQTWTLHRHGVWICKLLCLAIMLSWTWVLHRWFFSSPNTV